MRGRLAICATAFLTIGLSYAGTTAPPADAVERYIRMSVWRGDTTDKLPPTLARWINDARAALGGGDFDRAVATLSEKYALPHDQMAELLRLWVTQQTGDFPPGSMGAKERQSLAQGWAALAAASGYKPLVLEAVAKAMNGDEVFRCDAALFEKMLAKAPDRLAVAWQVVRTRNCHDWLLWVMNHAGDRRFVPLTEALHDQNLHVEDTFPIYDWLISAEGMAHVAAEDREAVAIKLHHDYALAEWRAGLVEAGLKTFEALSAKSREKLLAGDRKTQTATADGLAFDLGGTEAEAFRLNLAAALAQKGRVDEARVVFARSTALALAHKYLACHPADARMSYGDPCGDPNRNFAMAMLLNAILGSGSDKLGILAQTLFADSWLAPEGVMWTELTCRSFEPRFPKVCADARAENGNWRQPLGEPDDLAATAAVLTLPHFSAARARYYATTEQVQKQWRAPPPDPHAIAGCVGGAPPLLVNGESIAFGPGQPGTPISYRDPQTGITLYAESDGRHLAAFGPDGTLKWMRNPFEDAHLCPYRIARPVIAYIEPATTFDIDALGQWPHKKLRAVILHFDSSQFGAVDLETGDFTIMGQN